MMMLMLMMMMVIMVMMTIRMDISDRAQHIVMMYTTYITTYVILSIAPWRIILKYIKRLANRIS